MFSSTLSLFPISVIFIYFVLIIFLFLSLSFLSRKNTPDGLEVFSLKLHLFKFIKLRLLLVFNRFPLWFTSNNDA